MRLIRFIGYLCKSMQVKRVGFGHNDNLRLFRPEQNLTHASKDKHNDIFLYYKGL